MYKLNKVDDPYSCIDRQGDTIRTNQQEINRLRGIIDKKDKALNKAVKQVTNTRNQRNHYINENSDLKNAIEKLKVEKAELTQALNKSSRPVGRTDQNWDGGFRAEAVETNEKINGGFRAEVSE